jgi:hypothetical protein
MELVFLYLFRLFHRRTQRMEDEALHSKPMVNLVNGLWDYFVKDQSQKSLSFENLQLMLTMEQPGLKEEVRRVAALVLIVYASRFGLCFVSTWSFFHHPPFSSLSCPVHSFCLRAPLYHTGRAKEICRALPRK